MYFDGELYCALDKNAIETINIPKVSKITHRRHCYKRANTIRNQRILKNSSNCKSTTLRMGNHFQIRKPSRISNLATLVVKQVHILIQS